MISKFNGDDVIVTFNGEQLGTLQSFEFNNEEKKIKNGDNLKLFNREYSITLEDVEVDPNFINKLIPTNQMYTVVGTSFKYPRGNKLPKKKRIRNKWIKKYHKEFELENCRFV